MGDDELLMTLMNVPNQWMVVCDGLENAPASSLRQALRKAHEISSKAPGDDFPGQIVKQPYKDMVVEAHQISRLWKHLDLPS
jgi:hypothetical protein